jgi:hypothetical protein
MINNVGVISKKYKCGGILGNYLIYVEKLPLLGIEGKWFYFSDNEKLRKILKDLPLWLKIIGKF